MNKKLILIFLFFLIIIPNSVSVSRKITGYFILNNSQPTIDSIAVYSTNRYEQPKTNFIIDDKTTIYIKAKINDLNGYREIKNVKIKIVFLNKTTETIFERFGAEYVNAKFESGSGTEATYTYNFDMIGADKLGYYRIKVQTDDGNATITSHKDYTTSKKDYNSPTTLAVVSPATQRKTLFDLIKSIIKVFMNIFQ